MDPPREVSLELGVPFPLRHAGCGGRGAEKLQSFGVSRSKGQKSERRPRHGGGSLIKPQASGATLITDEHVQEIR